MRKKFIEILSDIASKDPKVILIVTDVGFSYVEDFAAQFPKQFINLGVTEQSAVGIAAGLAMAGYKPWLYSMINFVLMRPYEQVRNDICFNNANVKLIGVKGSVHYKFLGFSHNLMGKESEADLLRNLPNIQLRFPKTEKEVEGAVRYAYVQDSPIYIRL